MCAVAVVAGSPTGHSEAIRLIALPWAALQAGFIGLTAGSFSQFGRFFGRRPESLFWTTRELPSPSGCWGHMVAASGPDRQRSSPRVWHHAKPANLPERIPYARGPRKLLVVLGDNEVGPSNLRQFDEGFSVRRLHQTALQSACAVCLPFQVGERFGLAAPFVVGHSVCTLRYSPMAGSMVQLERTSFTPDI
jgi:hypothetical protein